MCGVAGLVSLTGSDVPSMKMLGKMVTAIRHRGPDDEGYHVGPGVGLAHARLSIIDLETGRQPIHNEDKTIWVVFNGEIFNFIELRHDLRKRGHTFYTESDTEVLVHLYEAFGDAFVEQLNGQFAFALWDSKQRRLLLGRDRAGILPLFFTESNGNLIFASEIKAILATELVEAVLDPAGLDEIFTFWCTVAPRTVFSGVQQVRPGELVTLSGGRVTRRRYWNWNYPVGEQHRQADIDELTDELVELLDDATRIRLRADVPVGAYLSGGLDSSSLVALMQRHVSQGLQTFSIAFEDGAHDESSYQMELANYLETEHSAVQCNAEAISNAFVQTVGHTETPILRTAPTPMCMLSQLVRDNNIKVVMTGEGADEVLGGYDIFKEAKVREFWSKQAGSDWRPLLLKRLYPYLDFSSTRSQVYLKAFFGSDLARVDSVSFAHLPRWHMTAQLKMFYSDGFKERVCECVTENFESTVPDSWRRWHRFNRWEYVEATTILPGYILSSQGDRMLMANSVEGRFPYLDHRLIEFAERIPPAYKMRVLREKYLLKRGFRDKIPASIINRTKQPYRAPNAESFLDEDSIDRFSEYLANDRVVDAGYFDASKVERLWKKIRNRRAVSERDSMAITALLSTQIWHDQFVNGGVLS